MTETFRIPRPTQLDLMFEGELLAEQSSHEEGKAFWTEIRIYKTIKGLYITEQRGVSADPEQGDKVRVSKSETPEEVRESLRRRQGDREFFTDLALEALAEAVEKAPELNEASAEWL